MDFKIAPESGNAVIQTIHASEGGRAIRLLQQRHKMQQHLREAKEKLETKGLKKKNITWGGSAADRLEEQFKRDTIGLVSAEDFKERRAKLEEQIKYETKELFTQKFREKRKLEFRLVKSKLSFAEEEIEEVTAAIAEPSGSPRQAPSDSSNQTSMQPQDCVLNTSSCIKDSNERDDGREMESGSVKVEATTEGSNGTDKNMEEVESKCYTPFKTRRKIGKDPTVDTSYLPDKERDEKMAQERQRLVEEYRRKEDEEKRKPLNVTYSYWDGTGHRRRIQILRGMTVGEFLEMARRELEKEFIELRTVPTDNLMYVKEDLILPHNITFYDLIKSKARGKSGPLFHFDAHDDIRLFNDVRVEKEDSHAGKIVDKKWFERHKHIFPASRWEVFNPSKTYDTYTIRGEDRMWKGVADHVSVAMDIRK